MMFHTGIESFASGIEMTMAKGHTDRKHDRGQVIGEAILAVRAFQNAQDVFDDAAVDVLGINRSDGRCLDILDQHGSLTAGELARRADLSSAAITTLVDRMERAGYLTRVRDTVDRRRVLIAGTEQAHDKCSAIWGPIEEESTTFLGGFTDEELQLVTRFMHGARELLLGNLDRIKVLAQPEAETNSPAEPGTIRA